MTRLEGDLEKILIEKNSNDDLEIESIEFIKIAAAIQQHFGQRLDVSGWLSGKSIHELISLSVGDLSAYVTAALTHEA